MGNNETLNETESNELKSAATDAGDDDELCESLGEDELFSKSDRERMRMF